MGERVFSGASELADFLAHFPRPHRIEDPRVLDAIRAVPREEFVPPEAAAMAYADTTLEIGEGQTISQPLVVAAMSEALELRGSERVLEVGTGSGYQAAVLSRLCREVFTVEIIEKLSRRAQALLGRQGRANVRFRVGDGCDGWPEAAPFAAILVACAAPRVPEALLDQLAVGGRLILPVGPDAGGQEAVQDLVLIRRTAEGFDCEKRMDVRFVPMTGAILA